MQMDTSLGMIIKHRNKLGQVADMYMVGDVKDKNVIIVDDMIDTGGTICEAVKNLKKNGAKNVDVFVTHGIFSGNAFERFKNSEIDKIITTNTIPAKEAE